MNRILLALRFGFVALCVWVSPTFAVTIPFTEEFDTTNENWKNSLSNLSVNATGISTGGPDGVGDTFIRSTFTTGATGIPSSSQVLFRARNTVNSSDNEFFGDWIANDVETLDFWFRHAAPTSLFVGLRIPTANGFPAMLGRFPVAVEPNTWTHLSMEINNTNPELLDETGNTHNNFNDVFSNITSIQIFANLSGQANSATYNFDLDAVRVVTEASSIALGAIGMASVVGLDARRRQLQSRSN